MSYRFSSKSLHNLKDIHPDLVKVVTRALELTTVDFAVIEGLRTEARQRQLLKAGATTTMNSRHLTGHAVDLAPVIGGKIRWDWPPYYQIADAMKKASAELGIKVEWGGDWISFKDGPHWQLPRKEYP